MTVLFFLAWAIAVLLELLGPLAVAVWYARRRGVGFQPFLFGAAIFLVFQVLTRVPAVQIISQTVAPHLLGNVPLQVLYMVVLAFTAGLFESVGRWVGYRFLFRDRLAYRLENGVAYGLGHGGFESAVLVGLNQAVSLVLALAVVVAGVGALSEVLPAELVRQLSTVPQQISHTPWYMTLVAAYERAMTIPFHVAMSLVVLQCFVRGQRRWLWVAVGLHSLLDCSAPAMLSLLGWPVVVVEAYLTLWAAGAVWYIVRTTHTSRAEVTLPS